MPARLTQEEFINRARKVWGDKYDLSYVKYEGGKRRVTVYCSKHGFFETRAEDFLHGHGCHFCGRDRKKSRIQGVGVNDDYSPREDPCKRIWSAMMARCYSPKNLKRNPTYREVQICDEWKNISNFRPWFNQHYRIGYNLDKDILEKGNKIYCPDKCCFVPQEINKLIIQSKSRRGVYPIGVSLVRRTGEYVAHVNINGEQKHIGIFGSPEKAFAAYKQAKEAYIKEVAQEYYDSGQITKRVYDALMRYEVEITD